jgi:hypothetical protein
MKGAMLDVWANINSNPNNKRTITIGINHHSLRFQRNVSSSPMMPRRDVSPLNICIRYLRQNCFFASSRLAGVVSFLGIQFDDLIARRRNKGSPKIRTAAPKGVTTKK